MYRISGSSDILECYINFWNLLIILICKEIFILTILIPHINSNLELYNFIKINFALKNERTLRRNRWRIENGTIISRVPSTLFCKYRKKSKSTPIKTNKPKRVEKNLHKIQHQNKLIKRIWKWMLKFVKSIKWDFKIYHKILRCISYKYTHLVINFSLQELWKMAKH